MIPKFSPSRRRFLQNTALFSAGLTLPFAKESLAQNAEFVDAIIIGSGFGGSVAALRLAQSGIDTLVIERGRRWPITPEQNTFATFRNPDGRSGWLRTSSPIAGFGFGDQNDGPINYYTGVLERIDSNPSALERIQSDGMIILNGAGVGGGSLVYNAIHYQPTRANFQRIFPSGISYDEMENVYYPRARAMLRSAPTPPDILNTPYYQGTRVMLEQGQAAGFPTRLLDLGVNWDIVRQEINGTRVPSAIAGETWYGLNSGAKFSLDHEGNYLAEAEKTGKVRVAPLHSVVSIAENPGGGYRIFCNQITETGQLVASKVFRCRLLFLGAGSVGTTTLLVRAKAQGTLPKLNNFVGQGWAGNGDILGLRFNLPNTNINNLGQGGPAGAVIEDFSNPIVPISLMTLAQWNATTNLLGLGIGIPLERATWTFDAANNIVRLNWPPNANAAYVKALYRMLARIDQRNTSLTQNPFNVVIAGTTAHPLGGAVMNQVCDLNGQVLGYDGLYVVDGALIPGSTACCNPALTITAIAERSMDRILNRPRTQGFTTVL